jgi:hypothetical protein
MEQGSWNNAGSGVPVREIQEARLKQASETTPTH